MNLGSTIGDVVFDVAKIVGAAKTEQSGAIGQIVQKLLQCFPGARMMTGNAKGSKSPTRLFCGNPLCGLMPMLVALDIPCRNGAQRTAASQMTRDDLRVRFTQKLRRPLGDIAMAGSVKAPAFDAVLLGPFQRHRVQLLSGRNCLVESCFKSRDKRNIRQFLGQEPHGSDIRRIVSRRDVVKCFHGRQHACSSTRCTPVNPWRALS